MFTLLLLPGERQRRRDRCAAEQVCEQRARPRAQRRQREQPVPRLLDRYENVARRVEKGAHGLEGPPLEDLDVQARGPERERERERVLKKRESK